MEIALTNVLIIDKIFSHFTSTNYKNLRLVCKAWNRALLTGKNNHIILDIGRVYHESYERLSQVIHEIDANLFRRIKIADDNSERLRLFLPLLQQTLTSHIQYLDIDVDETFLPVLCRLLSKDTPNVQIISIHLRNYGDDCLSNPFEIGIPAKHKLQQITISVCPKCPPLRPWSKFFFHNLILASSNLTNLILIGNYIPPSIAADAKLERLEIVAGGFIHSLESEPTNHNFSHNIINIAEIFGLVQSVAKTLKILELHCYPGNVGGSLDNRKLPYMPNLKRFTNCDISAFKLDGANWLRNMPSLTKLRIGTDPHPNWNSSVVFVSLKNIVENKYVAEKVTILTIGTLGFSQEQFVETLYQLKQVFPSLKKLDLSLAKVQPTIIRRSILQPLFFSVMAPFENAILLGEVLLAIAFLRLKSVKLRIPFRYEFSIFVDAWSECAPSLFENLQSLEICNEKVVLPANLFESACISKFCAILLSTKEIESMVLQNYTFEATVANQIFKCIMEHQLPVKFISGVCDKSSTSLGLKGKLCPMISSQDGNDSSRRSGFPTWKTRRAVVIL